MVTRLGSPAISDPRVFDLRAFQLAVANTRQRIEALEGIVNTLQSTGNFTALTSAIAVLQAQVAGFVTANGTVTSVAATVPDFMSVSGSPITTFGTLAFSFDDQAAGTFLAGPVSGADDTPAFRGIEWNFDIPLISTLPFISGVDSNDIMLVERYGTMYWTTVGSVVSGGGGGGGGGGTVTSVAATVPSFLSISGSPITTSGTLAITLVNESANTVFAGPTSGGAAAPTFRALQWNSDIPLASGLSSAGALTGAEILAVERSSSFLKTTAGDIAALAGSSLSVQIDTYSAAGSTSWSKPTGAKWVDIIVVGGGGGGGSGSASNTSNGVGGAGGGGAALCRFTAPASTLGSTETVVVGAGGGGGATVTTTLTGNAGTAGGVSSFAGKFFSYGGGGGAAGTNNNIGGGGGGGSYGAGGNGGAGTGGAGGDGGGQSGTNTNTTPTTNPNANGGAAGGGVSVGSGTSGAVGGLAAQGCFGGGGGGVSNGGSGGGGKDVSGSVAAAGGAAGNNGNTVAGIAVGYRGAGGGGGGGRTGGGTAPGNGGAGQQPGGGGGGGGGTAANGQASGAGAAGGDGIVVVITHF